MVYQPKKIRLQNNLHPSSSFTNHDMIMIPYNSYADQFWYGFDQNIMPVSDLIIQIITELINNRTCIIPGANTNHIEDCYYTLYCNFGKHLNPQELTLTNVTIRDQRITKLIEIFHDTKLSATFDDIVNLIVNYIYQLSPNNQLTISHYMQTAILISAMSYSEKYDPFKYQYDDKSHKWKLRIAPIKL